MNFLNLQYFIAIAEEQSISAAARKLFVSQQALSEHVKKMENELGVPLFKREPSLSLTVAGECLLEGGKKILSTYEQTLANIVSVTDERRSKITIGISTYDLPPFLPELIRAYSNKYPNYEVSVIKRQHNDIAHNMMGVDLYVTYLPLDDSLAKVQIVEDDSYAILLTKTLMEQHFGDEWPAACKVLSSSQSLSQYAALPFVILKDRHGHVAHDIAEIFETQHFMPKTGFVSENGDLNFDMCLKGMGCLLSSNDSLRRRKAALPPKMSEELLLFPVKTPNVHAALTISYEKHKKLHTAEMCFINMARELLSNDGVISAD